MPERVTHIETPLKPYIQMFFRSPKEFINTRYTSKELYDKSKIFALENGTNHQYSIQEFGKGITKLIGQYKKRTNSGITYDLHMNINDFDRMLIEYNPEKEYSQVPNPNNRTSIFTQKEKIKMLEISKIRDRGYADKRQREAEAMLKL
jgi:hypothetical protein